MRNEIELLDLDSIGLIGGGNGCYDEDTRSWKRVPTVPSPWDPPVMPYGGLEEPFV